MNNTPNQTIRRNEISKFQIEFQIEFQFVLLLSFFDCFSSKSYFTITDKYVRSYLSCPKFKYVIEIVQLSRVQAAGNLVLTQAILLACDRPIPKEMVSQAFIGACMRLCVSC